MFTFVVNTLFKILGVSKEQAIAAVTQAAADYADNTERREFAVKQLMVWGLRESIARWAVEMAVVILKRQAGK